MPSLGTKAPEFTLPDAQGALHTLDFGGKAPATLVIFTCVHCPYVTLIKEHLSAFTRKYMALGVQVLAIHSNDPNCHPEDCIEGIVADNKLYNFPFPNLVDEDQSVAKAYHAACTPDIFLFDASMKLAYRGQYDSSRPGSGKPVTGSDLSAALEAVLKGSPVSPRQFPSMGCSIKWKPGNEPTW
ncbi:MAG: thioredoxin family protein [Opitutales bacterium]|jgi:peroxiredoxin